MTNKKESPVVSVLSNGSAVKNYGPPRDHPWRFAPRNTAALVHGGNSERVMAARAEIVHEELLAVAPWLDEPIFAPAVARYLAAAACESLLDDHVRTVSAERGPGAVSSRVWEQLTAARRLAAKLAQDLGLDPVGQAKLRTIAGQAELTTRALTSLVERGRRLRHLARDPHAIDLGNGLP